MKQPSFWFKDKSLIAFLLSPFGFLYEKMVWFRLKIKKPHKVKIPVVCVGNISVGGTGKTPLSLALADYFIRKSKNVFFLNHGYKSNLQNVMIDLREHKASDVSDEAMIFAMKLPTVVDKNRARGAQKAQNLGADIVIMDDGFQNPTVYKQLSFVVFDGKRGVGNGLCMPSGPLRETLKQGLKRANAAVIVGNDETCLADKIKDLYPRLPVLFGHLEPKQSLKGLKGIAFAGIGHPEKFYTMLEKSGVTLLDKVSFPDHYAYNRSDIQKLLKRKQPLFTTLKDAVKIDEDLRARLTIVDVDFIFDNLDDWEKVITRKIK